MIRRRTTQRARGASALQRAVAVAVAVATASIVVSGCDTPHIRIKDPPLRVVEEVEGHGPVARDGQLVTIEYCISMPDGATLLQDEGHRFVLGQGTVIAGLERTVRGMRLGGRRSTVCPPHLHWGREGYGGVVPPDTTVRLQVRLLAVSASTR